MVARLDLCVPSILGGSCGLSWLQTCLVHGSRTQRTVTRLACVGGMCSIAVACLAALFGAFFGLFTIVLSALSVVSLVLSLRLAVEYARLGASRSRTA